MKTMKVITVMMIIYFGLIFSVQAQETARGTSPQYNNAVYISQSIPGNMGAGQSYGVSVTMKNTGQSVWRQGGYTLNLSSVSASMMKVWSVSSVDLNSTINPGEVVIFNPKFVISNIF